MNRNSRYLRGSSLNPTPRWRNVFIALMLALTFGGADQIAPAHAAPAGGNVRIYIDVVNPKTTLCVGEGVAYIVKVVSQFTSPPPGWTDKNLPKPFALPGISVEATSGDKTVGDFHSTEDGFETHITGLVHESTDSPHVAYFGFRAKKAGKTTLYFNTLTAEGQFATFHLPVRVINCKYKVITTSQMSKCYPNGCIKFLGVIVGGRVTADETGYIFTGEAPVVWLSTSAVPSCSAVNTLGISTVKMRGNLSDSGQLLLELDYDTVAFHDVVSCPGGGGSGNALITPSPLRVTVPSSGGVIQLEQTLDADFDSVVGSANVYVIPLEASR